MDEIIKKSFLKYKKFLFNYKLWILILILISLIGNSCYDSFENLGEGYVYYRERSDMLGDSIDIAPYILNHEQNKRFIIIKQYKGFYNAPADYKIPYSYPVSPSIYYFLIDKKNHNFYGPLTAVEFNHKCDSLMVNISFKKEKEKRVPEGFRY